MTGCEHCGGATTMIDETGGVKAGQFSETYECVNCGRKGWIRGDASAPPREWNKAGGVFQR